MWGNPIGEEAKAALREAAPLDCDVQLLAARVKPSRVNKCLYAIVVMNSKTHVFVLFAQQHLAQAFTKALEIYSELIRVSRARQSSRAASCPMHRLNSLSLSLTD